MSFWVVDLKGNLAEGEKLYERGLAIWEDVPRPDQLAQYKMQCLHGLFFSYFFQARYADAATVYERELTLPANLLIPGNLLSPRNYFSVRALTLAAEQSRDAGDYARAERLFKLAFDDFRQQVDFSFRYLSEKDRLSLFALEPDVFPNLLAFAVLRNAEDPELTGWMYDVLLFEKGLVASSVADLRAHILTSGDTEISHLLDQLSAKRSQLARLRTVESEDHEKWSTAIDELQQEANEIEQELARRSSSAAWQKQLVGATWRDVQNELKKDEAAVEFMRFPVGDSEHHSTESYFALVVTPNAQLPRLVPIGNAAELEGAPLEDYRRRVGLKAVPAVSPQPDFYHSFWRPLEPALAGAKRIYISPDGVLNEVSLGAVADDRGRPLIQRYDLRILSSTKDLLRERRELPSRSAILIGNPKFDLSAAEERAALEDLHSKATQLEIAQNFSGQSLIRGLEREENCPERPPGGVLCPLPGTAKEVDAIWTLLQRNGWQANPPYVGARALKEVLEGVQHPRLLHIATHGFFQPDQQVPQIPLPGQLADPMFRSGLLLAGADRILNGEATAPDLDNGVLTAYEARSLNLQGTELVVLSACETGLGQVQNGEGVLGLQRALQEAGAESVLMSMWAVPDRETQELMTLFYERWLSGKAKPIALREAELEMRKRVKKRYGRDIPAYWGGFVLVGR